MSPSRVTTMNVLLILSFIMSAVIGTSIQGLKYQFARKCLGIAGACVSLTFSVPMPSQATDAFDGAFSAMTAVREKTVVERDFANLPEATKKRKALAACKDSSARSSSGYSSASQCSNAVLQGNYDAIMKGAADGGPLTLPSRTAAAVAPAATSTSSPSTPAASGTSTKSSSPIVAKAEIIEEPAAPLKKKTDLSGVAPAAKKRRALAACKKAETRKFARMGSEAKCTESVLKGDFDNIIEALEYGK